jgi:hypothetical protein
MNITKKTEHASYEVYPPLVEIATQIYHKVPSLSFESHSAGGITVQGGIEIYIHRLSVYNGIENVGVIGVDYEHFRNQGRKKIYKVTSGRIKNQIGLRNTKTTSLPAEALKTAVKVFNHTKSVAEIIDEIEKKMNTEVHSVRYNSTRNAERIGEDFLIDLLHYVTEVDATEGNALPLPTKVQIMLKKPNLRTLLDTAKIVSNVSEDFDARHGVIVREERDGSLTSVDLNDLLEPAARLARHRDTYGLPELYQTKLAMLKMMDYKQAIDSIGIKFKIENINWYYLPSRDIITTS